LAHELRTPVAALRSTLEFRLRDLSDEAHPEGKTLRICLGTVERMQRLVSDLLLLARLESGREPLDPALVDVVSILSEYEEMLAPPLRERGMTLVLPMETAGEVPAAVESSPEHLRCIIGNLLGNAVAHGLPQSTIEVTWAATAAGTCWTIQNACSPEVDGSDLDRPFHRGDRARRADGHSGLGLTLCRRLARLLGATIAVSASAGRFSVELTLPATLPLQAARSDAGHSSRRLAVGTPPGER
jgi:two-component system OmpR family sensor kinase